MEHALGNETPLPAQQVSQADDAAAAPAPSETLREATLVGVRWVALARVIAEVMLLASTVVLARLLPPAAFGHAAVALIFTSLAGMLIVGVAAPLLIQRPQITRAECEASALLGILLGAAFTGATVLGAPLIATPVFGSETAHLVQLASVGFLISGLSAAPQALLQRHLRFRRLSGIEIVATVLGTTLSIGLALAGAGAGAIVAGALAGLAVWSAGSLLATPFVAPRWHRREIAEVARFGAMAAMSGLAALTYSNIDYAIVGARLSPAALGLYWRAYQLGAEYQGKISVVMLRLAFPVYSRSTDIDQLRRLRKRIVRAHATIIFPLLAILIATAPELIPFVYGQAWRAAVVPTQILAAVGMMAAVLTGIGQLMFALGELRRMVILSWISVALYATTIYLVAPLGLTAVCIADACLYFALLISSHYFLAQRQAGIPLRSLWGEVGPALAATALILAICGPLAGLLHRDGLAAPLLVLAVTAVALPSYLLAIRVLSRAAWEDVRLLRSRVLPGRRGAAEAAAM